MFMTPTRLTNARTLASEPFNALMSDFINDFLAPSWRSEGRPANTVAQARLDVLEKGDRYEAFLEMPGVSKEDVEVRIDGHRVSVSAEAKSDQTLKEGERVVYSERSVTRWARGFDLPCDIDDTTAEASYENGVLKLSLPKKQETLPRRLAIK